MAIDLNRPLADILRGLDLRLSAIENPSSTPIANWPDTSASIDIDMSTGRAWVAGVGQVSVATLIANLPGPTTGRGTKIVGNPASKPTARGALDSALRASAGTIVVETQTAAADEVANARVVGGTGFHGIINMVDMDRATSFNGADSTPPAIAGIGTFAGPSRTAVRWGGSGAGGSRRAVCMNGGNVATAATGTAPPAAIYIGVPGSYQTDTQSMQGYARRITVWETEASDAEMVSRTTVSFPEGPPNIVVPKIVFVSDFAQDVDDMGALAVLVTAHARGDCQLLGCIASTPFDYSAPAMRATLDRFGLTSIPVGAYKGTVGFNGSAYAQQIANEFGQAGKTRADFPDSISLLRQLLAANTDVVVNSVGGFQDLAALLKSPADAASPLTGLQLVTAKVNRLVMMGGVLSVTDGAPQYYSSEFNFQEDPTNTAYVLGNWPTKRTIADWRIGNLVNTIPPSTEDPATNPFKRAYDLFATPATGRGSWDPIATLVAIYGVGPLFSYAHSGGTLTYTNPTMNYDPEKPGLDTFIWRDDAVTSGDLKAVIEGMMVVPLAGHGGGTPTFTKPTDANVKPDVWSDVSDAESVTVTNGAVSAIANKGSSGGSAAQATAASRPSLTTLNDRDALLFDSGTKFLDQPLVNNGAYFDFWWFGSIAASAANDARIAILTSSQAEDYNGTGGLGVTLNASKVLAFRNAGTGGNAEVGYADRDVPLMIRVTGSTTTPLAISVNGGPPVTSRTITENFASLVLRIGAGKTASGANNPFRGKVGEWVTWSAPIRSTDVAAMKAYAARWGINV